MAHLPLAAFFWERIGVLISGVGKWERMLLPLLLLDLPHGPVEESEAQSYPVTH